MTGADRPYLAIRADLRGDDNVTLNPHISAYYSYVSLVLQSSMARVAAGWKLDLTGSRVTARVGIGRRARAASASRPRSTSTRRESTAYRSSSS